MRFADPLMLWFIWLLPGVVLLMWWARSAAARRLRRFADAERFPQLLGGRGPSSGRRRAAIRILALGAVIAALARPQWGASEVEVEQSGIELVVALDISRSMLATDIKPSRLVRAKAELGALLESLSGDRVGLVYFAGAAFPQCPLTVDYAAVRLFLSQADPSMIGDQGTDLAAALDNCMELFGDEDGSSQRVILLVTDGEDFGEGVDEIVDSFRAKGVQVYAVGMGTPEGSPIPNFDDQGIQQGFVRDREGSVVISRLDETPLLSLSRSTGGIYVRAGAGGVDTRRLAAELRGLQGASYAAKRVTNYEERAAWPLGLALLLLIAEMFWPATRRRPA